MKIEVTYQKYNDYKNAIYITVDNKHRLAFEDGEQEDNNLSRNFNDCYEIINFMKMAYDAGKNGELWESFEFNKKYRKKNNDKQ